MRIWPKLLGEGEIGAFVFKPLYISGLYSLLVFLLLDW